MSLRAGDRSVLEPNMTFHFMTGLWMDDWGFEITESFVITDGAPEILANTPRELLIKD
jgi:ectoine hydrolase